MEVLLVKSRGIVLAGAVCLLALWPASALGHGETTTTDPEAGAALGRAPKTVSVTLSEPPAENARFTVTDGCGDTVSDDPQVDDATLSTAISGGEPGKWEASYRVISSVDGHLTKDTFAFQVDGNKDCSANEPKEPKNEDGRQDGEGGGTARGSNDDDGSSFPVVPVAAGTVALVGLALVIRTRSAH